MTEPGIMNAAARSGRSSRIVDLETGRELGLDD